MRSIITLFIAAMAFAPVAQAQDNNPPPGHMTSGIVGVLTRSDGFQQTTLVTDRGALSFAVPGDWKAIQLDFKLPVATAVYEVPDPSTLDGASSTNCSMAFADPNTPEGQALISRVTAFGGDDSQHNGWTLHSRTEAATTIAPATVERVATRAQGFVTAVAMCAWSQTAQHDAAYDGYMAKIFNTLLDQVSAPTAPFKARPGETFFSPQ
jgi:hypothetical protein